MAHYLLVASPLSGHLMPMVHIGMGLRDRGHTVTVLTGAGHEGIVGTAGLRFVALPEAARIDPPAAAPDWMWKLPTQARRYLLGRAELNSVFVKPLAAQAASFKSLLNEEAFDAILVDVTFTGALPVLLDDGARPPILVCGVGPLTLSSADIPPFGMAWHPRADFDYRSMTSVAHRIIMGRSQRQFNKALREANSGPAPVFISDWPRVADGLLQLSVQGFEYLRADLPATVEFVGPVLPQGLGEVDPPTWWDDVVSAPAVVHVTQGTFDNADLDQLIGPTLRALGDRDDLLVIATTGGRPGQQISGPIPSNARVVDWLPYSLLMPQTDVMITNGGYGGVQYALSHGVPLIVAGETSDKAEVAARVEHFGVGIDLGTAFPSSRDIREAVERITAHADYHDAAKRMRQEIESSAPITAIAEALERCVVLQ